MMQLEDIKSRLYDRNISKVAEATGLHVNTVRAIKDGTNKNPNLSTLKLLSAYFEANL